jgi:hypothetical protein
VAYWPVAADRGVLPDRFRLAEKQPGQTFELVSPTLAWSLAPALAVGENGDAVVAQLAGRGLLVSLRPAGSGWRPPEELVTTDPDRGWPSPGGALAGPQPIVSASIGKDGGVVLAYRSPDCSVYGAYRPPRR